MTASERWLRWSSSGAALRKSTSAAAAERGVTRAPRSVRGVEPTTHVAESPSPRTFRSRLPSCTASRRSHVSAPPPDRDSPIARRKIGDAKCITINANAGIWAVKLGKHDYLRQPTLSGSVCLCSSQRCVHTRVQMNTVSLIALPFPLPTLQTCQTPRAL